MQYLKNPAFLFFILIFLPFLTSCSLFAPDTPPGDILLSNKQISENQKAGQTVGQLSIPEQESDEVVRFFLVPGRGASDNANFRITGNRLVTQRALDFEKKTTHQIRIRAVNEAKLSLEKSILISVSNQNEAPVQLNLSSDLLFENQKIGTLIGRFSALDPDRNDTFSYALVQGEGDRSNASFTIEGTQLLSKTVLDYEQQSSYQIRVRVTDQQGLFTEKAMIVQLQNQNEAPRGLAFSPRPVFESEQFGIIVGTFGNADPDLGDVLTFKLVAGEGDSNNALFILKGKTLITATALDYENSPSYEIRVQATDKGGLTYENSLIIEISDKNEAPIDIVLTPGVLEDNPNAEVSAGVLEGIDLDYGDHLDYSLVSGEGDDDNTSFIIQNGELIKLASLFQDPKPLLHVRVRTTDQSGLSFEKALSITVLKKKTAEFSLSHSQVEENQELGSVIGHLQRLAPDDDDPVSYRLASGAGDADNPIFSIEDSKLLILATVDYETQNVYRIRIRATTEAGLSHEEALTLRVLNQNEAPSSLTLNFNRLGKSKDGEKNVGFFTGIDPDQGDLLRYSLVSGSGDTDNASFSIRGTALITAINLNQVPKMSYQIRVRATDSSQTFIEKNFTILAHNLLEWTLHSPMPQGYHLHGVTHGDGMFVVVGQRGSILTSSDGKVWKTQDSGTTNSLFSVGYGQNTFVAVGEGGTLLVSKDGQKWVPQESGTTASLFGVSYGKGIFVVVGERGTLLFSQFGRIWSVQSAGIGASLYDMSQEDKGIVAVGKEGTIFSSP